jgi:hypothetical protein
MSLVKFLIKITLLTLGPGNKDFRLHLFVINLNTWRTLKVLLGTKNKKSVAI